MNRTQWRRLRSGRWGVYVPLVVATHLSARTTQRTRTAAEGITLLHTRCPLLDATG